jgi:DeoR/GlpR family transcriptional regulator of sugar metabolism
MSINDADLSSPLAPQRRAEILSQLGVSGSVRVADLVARFGVSDMTIRRDILALAAEGLLTRVHGGAIPAVSSAHEPAFAAKTDLRAASKRAIALEAASLVKGGESVAIASGTTCYQVARELLSLPDLTVVTNSIPVATLYSDNPREDRTLLVTGGQRTTSAALAGPLADAMIDGLHVDWLFIGIHGIRDGLLTTPNVLEAQTTRALIRSAGQVVLVADSSKWNTQGLTTLAKIEAVDILITDSDLSEADIAEADEQVAELRVVTG